MFVENNTNYLIRHLKYFIQILNMFPGKLCDYQIFFELLLKNFRNILGNIVQIFFAKKFTFFKYFPLIFF